MDWKSIYLKDRIIEEIKRSNILKDLYNQKEMDGTYWLKELEDKVPGIESHLIIKNNNNVKIDFSYYLDSNLLSYKFEIDYKKETRDYKLNKILNM